MKKLIVFCSFVLLVSCQGREKLESASTQTLIDVSVLDKSFSTSINDFVTQTQLIVLKTEDKFFAEVTKLVIKNDKIYLLDGARGVILLVFDLQGNLLTSLAKQGEGPGEFKAASDLHVNEDGTMEVLDEALRKIITYNQDGSLKGEQRIPFAAEKFIKTKEHYFFYTNNIAFAFHEDSNETALVLRTSHELQDPKSIIPADMDRGDFYYITTQNFARLNGDWHFFQPFTNHLTNLNGGNDILIDFGENNFPADFFKNNRKKGVDLMNDLYNLGKSWDNGAFYDLGDYLYFKFQINLTVYMAFHKKSSRKTTVAQRDNWLINEHCMVSRFDPLAAIDNKLVFHLSPNNIKLMKDLSCFTVDSDHVDDNNVLMFWSIKE